jgi:prepilin-type N-terminal cleavage/methylation domain-containing protein
MSAPSRTRHAQRAGFTLIEVMVAASLFLIGIVGVVYMQSASVRSNQDAYESMVATHFARTWLDRIKRDALGWTAAGLPNVVNMFTAPARPGSAPSYFVPGALPATGSGLWPLDANESASINYHGVELGRTDPLTGLVVAPADIYYCAFGWFTAGPNNAAGLMTEMRADVTVWWSRKGSLEATNYADISAARASARGCDGVAFNPNAVVPATMRRVTLAAVLHWTLAQ